MKRRGRQRQTATARAYLELIRATLTTPPKMTRSEIARTTHDLAQPRQPMQADLFARRPQGR